MQGMGPSTLKKKKELLHQPKAQIHLLIEATREGLIYLTHLSVKSFPLLFSF